jgi:hypothetical protein
MEKHKFGVTCHDMLFMKTAPVTPKHEKYYIDVSHPGRTRMRYITHRSDWMQKHKFGMMRPSALFIESLPSPPKHEKYCIDLS